MPEKKEYPFDTREFVASAAECTGLVPSMPLDDGDTDAELANLYAVLEPVEKQKEVRKECQTKVRKRHEKL